MSVDAGRVIRELRELDARNGGERVAWTDVWADERARFVGQLREELPEAQIDRDEAGNVWAELPGERPGRVLVGSHLDCVPGGGWLDGCLGVLAGAEVLRAAAALPAAERCTVVLIDWADEEGARFGHSLLGSYATAGLLDVERARGLVDQDGVTLPDALAAHAVQLDEMTRSRTRLDGATAYLELHIEQGPVLDEAQLPASAVDGCLGVRRREIRFGGQAAHAGATPMRLRIDPVAAFAAFAADLRAIAEEHDGLTTIGVVRAEPGTPTAVPALVRCSIDLRHRDLASLEAMAEAAEGAAARAAGQTGCTFESSEIWSIDPIHFDADLVARAAALVPEGTILTSGPLHDAAAVSLAGVPTVMVFARTLGGLSHTRDEDAREEDLQVAIEAFGSLALELIRA